MTTNQLNHDTTAVAGQETLAAVDLGSNSFHLLLATVTAGKPVVVYKTRTKVQLAKYLTKERLISPIGLRVAQASLREFQELLSQYQPARLRVVATSAVREARNQDEFSAMACQVLGVPVEVISGEEEARLVYRGAMQAVEESSGQLVIDIGGGSTEIILGQGLDILALNSLNMGCVTMTQQFLLPTQEGWEALTAHVRTKVAVVAEQFPRQSWHTCRGCSGTVQSLIAVAKASGWSKQGLSAVALHNMGAALQKGISPSAMAGLETNRYDVFAAGVAIMQALFAELAIDNMVLSNGALREGILAEMLQRDPIE